MGHSHGYIFLQKKREMRLAIARTKSSSVNQMFPTTKYWMGSTNMKTAHRAQVNNSCTARMPYTFVKKSL